MLKSSTKANLQSIGYGVWIAFFFIVHTGDSAYALSVSLMKPFKEELENLQRVKDYNYAHSATRVSVENAIGRLKLKWGRLRMIRSSKTERIRLIIRACLVLHNFVLAEDCILNVVRLPEPTRLPVGNTGIAKREAITKWIKDWFITNVIDQILT